MEKLPFGFDTPKDSPGFLLWQTTMIWQRLIKKALSDFNLSHAEFVIMATLMWFSAHRFQTTQVLIAYQTKLDKMTVSKSLKKLTKNGFVSRVEHEKDSRAKSVKLTKSGEKIVETLVPIVEGIDAQFFAKTSGQEQKSLIQILAKLSKEKEDSTH